MVNTSLAGNQITHDGTEIGFPPVGVSGLARLADDVFTQTDPRSVVLQLGINDIQFMDDQPARIIDGIRQLVAQLQAHGLRVVVCTLGPFEGFASWTPEKETTRSAVNSFIRSEYEHVADFDAVLRDPTAPTKLRADFDSGDHLHPNDSGASALAKVIPLWWL